FETGQERFVMTRLKGDGSVDESFGRVDVGNQQFLSFWRGFDLAPDGSPIVHTQLARNLNSIYYVQHLVKFTADGTEPGPIALSDGTLSIAGSDAKDMIEVAGSSRGVILATRNLVGRVFDTADVSLIDIDAGGGNDVVTLASLTKPSSILRGD